MAVTDFFKGWLSSLDAPAEDHFPIVIGAAFRYASRGIYVGAGGDISVTSVKGTTVVYPAVPQGTVLPVRTVMVNAAGTVASGLVGMY